MESEQAVGRPTVTLSAGRNFLREYNELKAQGYTTLWVGEGRCCLQAPALGTPLPEPPQVIEEQV